MGWGGGQGRNRTADASLFRAALYQLSYLAGEIPVYQSLRIRCKCLALSRSPRATSIKNARADRSGHRLQPAFQLYLVHALAGFHV